MAQDPARNRLRTMLGELLDHPEDAQEVANGIAKTTPSTKRWPKRLVTRATW